MKIWTYRWQITLSKIDKICRLRIPKPDLHVINAHTKFGEKPLKFTQIIIQKRKFNILRHSNEYQQHVLLYRKYDIT